MRVEGLGIIAAFLLATTGYAAEHRGPPSSSAQPAKPLSATDKRALDDFARKISCGAEHHGPPDTTQLNIALMELDRLLPNIPPEEAAYLQREDAALLPQPSSAVMNARYAALVSRPLYYAWKARRAFDRANIATKAVYDPDHIPAADLQDMQTLGVQIVPNPFRDERADRIYRLIVSVAPIADAAEAIRNFLGSNANQLMTDQQRSDVKLKAFALSYFLQNALSCHFATYVLDRK